MELSKYAFHREGRLPLPPTKCRTIHSLARWETLNNDTLYEVFGYLNDRQLARIASVDKRTRSIARCAIKVHLGLGDSQWEVFKAVLERRESVLIMGNPGAGKSFLLNVLKGRLRRPLVTASTGAAADKIGALTLHSALCLGDGRLMDAEKLMRKVLHLQNAKGVTYKGSACKELIIDEVSMLTAGILDLARECLIKARGGKLPQMVVCGDPMQLGAVCAKKEGSFYDSKLVRSLRPYVLLESFRQSESSTFLKVLNRARLGRARESDVDWLKQHACPKVCKSAPRLFCRLADVEVYNNQCLHRLGSHGPVEYTCRDQGTTPPLREAEATLFLKVGARVMLNRNLHAYPSLHNGSCGVVRSAPGGAAAVVVAFDNGIVAHIAPVVQEFEFNGKVEGKRTRLPLILAFGVSVHRAQGATLDSVAVDLGKCFAPGQSYVALSRVRDIKDVEISGLSLWALNHIDKEALKYYKECVERSEARMERKRLRATQADLRFFEENNTNAALEEMMQQFEAREGGAFAPVLASRPMHH